MKKGHLRVLARRAALAIVVLAIGAGAWLARLQYTRLETPYRGYAAAEQFVDVASGLSPHAIGRLLVQAGVVRDMLSWRIAVWRTGAAMTLKAGEYRFVEPMTPAEVVGMLARGDVYMRTVTFPEGLTIRQMAEVYEHAGLGRASAFAEAARNVGLVSAMDPRARDLEGYLFPDTYSLSRRASAADLIRRMVSRFEAALAADLREAARARGLGVREIVTLASLVEKETARPDERPLVAAVYHNRLARGIALQCDPTVIYALEQRGRFNGNLTRADLSIDSPYNTYRYRGLPPGPIAAPGLASLEAAARPAPADYLFFVSRNDGSHAFAVSLRDHNRNVQQYQVSYFKSRARTPARTPPRAPARTPAR